MSQNVEVQSAFLSKINWTAGVTAGLAFLASFGLPISEEAKVQILTIVSVAGPFLIYVLRTFFTKSVTPSVAAKLP